MRQKYWLILPVLCFLTASLVLAYSSPGQPTGFVNDYADILTPEQEDSLESRLNSLSISQGSEVAVVTIANLGDDTIENFAVSLFAEWGIGKKGEDNGLLLLVAVEDREVRIEVGYGLEGIVTDAQSFWIIRDIITPAFRNGDYYTGISGAVDKLSEAIAGTTILPSVEENQSTERGESSDLSPFIGIALIALAVFLGSTKSIWLGGVIGLVAGTVGGFMFGGSPQAALIAGLILGFVGLIFDLVVSRGGGPGGSGTSGGSRSGGGSSGGFGGFGGGSSGGGGASGRW